MSAKVYIETSVVLSASLGMKVGGKYLKHDRYDNTCALLQYSQLCHEKGQTVFYTTKSVVEEANRVFEIALNNTIKSKLPSLAKRTGEYRRAIADDYFRFLNECLDQMEFWLSVLNLETVDSRKKDEIAVQLEDEFRNLDIGFRSQYGADIANFTFMLKGRLKKAARYARTVQRKDALKQYKPCPGRTDIAIMSEIAAINQGQGNEVYLVSEDGHFCAEQNRKLLEEKFSMKSRYSHEMLDKQLIRTICG